MITCEKLNYNIFVLARQKCMTFVLVIEGLPPSVAGRVEVIEIREGPGDDFISWSEPRPPHGIILHYYIRIIESGKETLIKDYNSTTISWDTWRNKWKITTSENVKIQVKTF